MCGIFGVISNSPVNRQDLGALALHSQQRGKDSSGLVIFEDKRYAVSRADFPITQLLKKISTAKSNIVLGHSRLITNGLSDNQPIVRGDVVVLHNGIIVNHESIWHSLKQQRLLEIDTEVIAALVIEHLQSGGEVSTIPERVLELCEGVVACALILPKIGTLCLFSNNGSLYIGKKGEDVIFASESFPLAALQCTEIEQVKEPIFIDLPSSDLPIEISDYHAARNSLVPGLILSSSEENLLVYQQPELKRCTKCLLPETMPFISFDTKGVCNYCHNYTPRNNPRPKEELFALVEPYRRVRGNECIVPFSGGRDSCYGLHLVVNELKMRPVTYTYDWGMVTDLGRRNISRMCAKLGVENIIVADNISKKREYISMNLRAWMRSPHLGMVNILTAGDKHFFRHLEAIKKQTGVDLNLWGFNPLEVTHFKAGFLGVPPDFEEKLVYSHGVMKQLRYQWLRAMTMLQSPGYFNRSLWDTLSGEYYRSVLKKRDYYSIFDYWRWDEMQIDDTLDREYGWERAPDTSTTWRIGDGTAAFYNYIYYTVAGFSEHDTFRSNQIREGDITREDALKLVRDENKPRYPNIKWYLDALGMDFREVISVVNAIPKLYR